MFGITVSDLLFRKRQFLIAIAGAALVFAMTLLLAGLAAGFSVEVNATVRSFGADWWVVANGSSSRVAALNPVAASAAGRVAASPGVIRATPVIIVPQTAYVAGSPVSVNMIGLPIGAMGSQQATQGRNVSGPGQAVVDARMDLGLGRTFSIGPRTFTVVGLTSGRTLLGGQPNVYVTLGDARTTAFRGADLLSAVLVTGTPRALPPGLSLRSNQAIEQGSLQQMASGISSINNSKFICAAIAAIIVASLVYVTALERNRDFAVLKALGASSRALFGGLALQSSIVTLIAAIVAIVMAQFMTGLFPQTVAIPGSAYLVLPLVAIGIGLFASLIALRRAVAADPARPSRAEEETWPSSRYAT